MHLNSKSVDISRTQLQIWLEMLDNFRENYHSKFWTVGRGQEDTTGTLASSVETVDSAGTHSPTVWCVLPGQRPGTIWTSPVLGTWVYITRGSSRGGTRSRRREEKEGDSSLVCCQSSAMHPMLTVCLGVDKYLTISLFLNIE